MKIHHRDYNRHRSIRRLNFLFPPFVLFRFAVCVYVNWIALESNRNFPNCARKRNDSETLDVYDV